MGDKKGMIGWCALCTVIHLHLHKIYLIVICEFVVWSELLLLRNRWLLFLVVNN